MTSRPILTLGICVPPRPRPGEAGFDRPERWGCLRTELHDALVARLVNAPVDVVDVDFRDAHIVDGEVLLDGQPLVERIDALFWYCEIDRTPGSYALAILQQLSQTIEVHPDPMLWARGVDKYASHAHLRAAGVAVPGFALVDARQVDALKPVMERWGAAVLKPRRGAWGKGVTLVEDWATLRDLVGYIDATSTHREGGFFLEQYLENDLDRWASVTMLGGEVMYGYRKRASKRVPFGGADSGRMKILDARERGGEADRCALDASQLDLAQRAERALGCPIIGFDMIWTADGPVIVDENTSPGNYAEIYAEVGKDPALELTRTILGAFGIS